MFSKIKLLKVGFTALLSATSFVCLSVTADDTITFSVDDIESLQGVYQQQLNIPKTANDKRRHSATINKQRQIQQRELNNYQNLLDAPQTNKAIYKRAQINANVVPAKSKQQAPVRRVVRQVQQPVRVPAITPNFVKTPDPDAIFEAANRGDFREIAKLVKNGVNINQVNNQRETALHMAAAKGHYSTVIYLVNLHM